MRRLCSLCTAATFMLLTALHSWAEVRVIPPSAVPLLQNRIRIDKNAEEVTFWVHRVPNSPSVILVRPDGSKLYEERHPKNVHWLSNKDIDIISIENPMRGPWQVLGKVLPKSRIDVVSNVSLQVTRLDRKLYQNERVKVTARLLIDRKPAKDLYYLSTATLRVVFQNFLNENDPSAVESTNLAEMKDDGKELDEVPNDGILTTNLVIKTPPGRYVATFITGSDVFFRGYTREVWVYPTPVALKYLKPKTIEDKPVIEFTIDEDEIKPETTVIQGDISNKSGHVEKVVLWAAEKTNLLTLDAEYQDSVLYSTELTLYGQTIAGREIVLPLPSFSFQYKEPLPPEPDLADLPPEPEIIEEEEESGSLLGIIIGVVVLLLLLGGGAAAFFILKKRKQADEGEDAEEETTEQPEKAAPKEAESKDKTNDEDDLEAPEDVEKSEKTDADANTDTTDTNTTNIDTTDAEIGELDIDDDDIVPDLEMDDNAPEVALPTDEADGEKP